MTYLPRIPNFFPYVILLFNLLEIQIDFSYNNVSQCLIYSIKTFFFLIIFGYKLMKHVLHYLYPSIQQV